MIDDNEVGLFNWVMSMIGQKTAALIDQAKAVVPEEISPITDIRASKDYRILVVKVMLERGLKNAMARLRGERVTSGAIWV